MCVCVLGGAAVSGGQSSLLALAEGADALQLWLIVTGSLQNKPEIWTFI